MKLLLLCLGLTLVCAHHEENHDVVTSNFDMSKISGEWYTILLASDVKEKVEETGSLKMFKEYIQALDDSSLLVKGHQRINGECAEVTLVADETEERHVYGVTFDGYNTFHITEAVYNDYHVYYQFNFNNEKKTEVLGLLARTPDVSPQLKKWFEKLDQHRGIPKENVVDLTNADRCLQARGSNGSLTSSAQ